MNDPREIIPDLSPEEELLLCCARTELAPDARARLRQLAAEKLNWERVERLAAPHRLRPLLYKHLKAEGLAQTPPAEAWAKIQNHAAKTVVRNLSLTHELAGILKLFRASGIEAIPFKGPVLAIRNYGNLGLREFFDMDLLLKREDLLPAKRILNNRGFASPWKQNNEWEQQHLDAQLGFDFLSGDGRVRFELHWSFIQRWLTYEVDLDGIWSRLIPWEFAGTTARIVSREDLLLYLCAHGAKHHWERLFWIVDIAEFARSEPGLNYSAMIKEARRLGNWRVLALGFHLARVLLDAPIPEEVWAHVQRDRSIPGLARQVGAWLFHDDQRPPSGAWVETKFYFGVKERLGHRASYARHQLKLAMAPSDTDRAFIKLPETLSFLYPLVRPVRWLAQRGKP